MRLCPETGGKAKVRPIPAYGVLQVDSCTPRAFTDTDIQFLRGYANLLASAVERLRIVRELRDRAEEKERLLRELQHRVKNNLQTVMNLVSLRVRRARTPEVAQELRAVGDGIEALRLVPDKIYSANDGMDRTCLGTYLGLVRIRPRMTYKPVGGVARARLVISPMIPRLAWPAILA